MQSEKSLLKSIHFIDQHLTDPITLDDIAASSCLSLRQLQRYFNKFFSSSIKHYLRERRITEASKLLILKPEATMTDIAFNYQFGSSEGFSRAFFKHFSCTPSEFRKRNNLSSPNQLPVLNELTFQHLKQLYSSVEQVIIPEKRFLGLEAELTEEGMSTEGNNKVRENLSKNLHTQLEKIKNLKQTSTWEINFRKNSNPSLNNTTFIGVEVDACRRPFADLGILDIPCSLYIKLTHQHVGLPLECLREQLDITAHYSIKMQSKQGFYLGDAPILVNTDFAYDPEKPFFYIYIPISRNLHTQTWWTYPYNLKNNHQESCRYSVHTR